MLSFSKRSLLLLTLVLPLLLSGQSADLARNFKNPPSEFSILPFWSWNGTLKPEKLKWQIDQMMDKGINGAFMHARSGLDESETPYFSEGFWNAVDTTIRYSASKGFHTYLYDEDKWPSGSAGGRTIASNPEEFVKKILNYSKMEVIGPQSVMMNLQSKPIAIFAGRISEKGVYDYSSQVNLTEIANKIWNVPAGRWAIISFEMIKDPHKQIDYLDSAAVAKFIEITHEAYFKRFGQYFGNTIPGVFFDEIYANGSSMDDNIFWTDDLPQKFRNIKGYDLMNKLPLIILSDPANSAKVRYDYFDVVRQLFIKSWFKQYADWCAAHKIWATGHTTEKIIHYKRQSDYFSTIGQLQVPGTDNEEYRYGFPRMIDWYNTKQISSIANLYNRKRVMAESMGGGGYTIPLEEYRYGFSMLGVYGINMFIPHLFHYTVDTPESQSDWPPSWFYTNPYWKYFKPLADFAKRISFMNSQGTEVCDVAILYPLTDLWVNGYPSRVDDAFYKEVQQLLLDKHINYNIIDPESLSKATIHGNAIEAGTGKYRVLILPEIHSVTLEVMKQISVFVEKGGTVIALKSLPSISESGPVGDEAIINEVKALFGISTASLRPDEYYQWNPDMTEHFTVKSNTSNGSACFTRFLNELPGLINNRIDPDFEVMSDNAKYLRFNHRRIDGNEMYLLVNDRNTPEKYHISLRYKGIPSIWNPENGNIQPVANYQINKGRTELILDFKPRESYFVALAEGKQNPYAGLLESTDLKDCSIGKTEEKVTVNGWGKSGDDHELIFSSNNHTISKKWKSNSSLPQIDLINDWQFQLAPHALDYSWSSSLKADTLELPVMKFHPERATGEGLNEHMASADFRDTDWKTVKIKDEYNDKKGIQRYLSGWNGWWISYYDNTLHLPATEGGNRIFRKVIVLDAAVREAKLALTADQSYELFVNDQSAGADNDWKSVEVYELSRFLKPGKNTLEIRTKNTRGLLLEGFINLKNNKNIRLQSDDSWMVSTGQADWQPAFRFASPPMGTWGNIPNSLSKIKFPLTVWYRQQLPPGATAIVKPEIKGEYSLYVNGLAVTINQSGNMTDISGFLKNNGNILALKVKAADSGCGLVGPLKVLCGKVNQQLVSWKELGLEWYSGRAMYAKKVNIPLAYLQKETRLMLDLGRVDYFAEIWVNGKLVTYCPWAPFEADITGFIHERENEISVVVANLQANKATWNILDDNISKSEARWWHDGSLMREKQKLESGLLGPVRIVPYVKESIEINLK